VGRVSASVERAFVMVPNKFPSYTSGLRLALIGEAPGRDEVQFGAPFVGASGRFLATLLSRAGVQKDACYLGNVSQYQPPNNDITKFLWHGDEIQHGLYQLTQDLVAFKPNLVVLLCDLGNIPLKAAKDCASPMTKKHAFSVTNWRGSLFLGNEGPFKGMKCMATYHPAFCLRDSGSAPFLQLDLRKAVREAASPLLNLPQRNFLINLSEEEIIFRFRQIRKDKISVAFDIEGYVDAMTCISFATSPQEAFILDCDKMSPLLWQEMAFVLEDPEVPKVLQNELYDTFVLHYSYGIRVQGKSNDIMIKHWGLYSELAKEDKTMSDSESATTKKKTRGKGGLSLAIQASLYTDEPYYKYERKIEDKETHHIYCCRDSAVTKECCLAQQAAFDGLNGWDQVRTAKERELIKEHYKFNMGMLNVMLYMELRGIKYDVKRAATRRQDLLKALHEAQAKLNVITGHGFSWTKGIDEIKNKAQEVMWTKKGDRPYKEHIESVKRLETLIKTSSPSLATIGEIEDLCEVSLNVDSAKQFQRYLYEILKLPVQMSDVRGQEPHVTSDYEALLKLSRWCQQNTKTEAFAIVQKAIEIRALGTRAQMLGISADKDGRIRCGYNLVGSNTGRITCYESPTGSGYNLQTIPNYTSTKEAPGNVLGDRDLFVADNDCWLFQCDLSGADGWTVAAYSAMLGDPNMLLDYKAGISPFKILTCMLRGWKVPDDRQEIAQLVKKIGKDDWDRFACKRVQHGGSYLEGGLTISRNILKDSEGKLYMTSTECDGLKNYFFTRYWGVRKWHDWIARRLKERPILVAASGQVRQFFGRPDEILTKAVAFEPQANTTYATNLAAWRLWSDDENRYSQTNTKGERMDCVAIPNTTRTLAGVSLRIEPLHQVHDALIGQFRKSDTHWAVPRVRSYFDNPLVIAGQTITIPFEGNFGVSWGNLNEGKI